MSRTRPAAVAGLFYPADASQLHRDILSMLESVEVTEKAPKALIVPHAGYIFSGPVAASAFAQLKNNSARIQRVILLGPCHRVPLRGLATSSADFFETPLEKLQAFADAGPTLKRWRPRARGRATRINKRTSHITIVVADETEEEVN